MQLIDIINLLIDKDKELFNKAFNIWCNIIYNRDAVYTEELVQEFINDTGLKSIYTPFYIDNSLNIRNSKWFLIYPIEDDNENIIYTITMYYNEKLQEFIKEYGIN